MKSEVQMETGFRTFDFKWCIILGSTLIHFPNLDEKVNITFL